MNSIRVQSPSPTMSHPVNINEQQLRPHHKPGGVALVEHTSKDGCGPWRCTTPPRDGSRDYLQYSQKKCLNNVRLRHKHTCYDGFHDASLISVSSVSPTGK